MSAFGVILTVIITISALFMIFTVLMQSSNVKGLGAIAGTFDSYFDKHKAKSAEAKLALNNSSKCMCNWGGVVSVTMTPAMTINIP